MFSEGDRLLGLGAGDEERTREGACSEAVTATPRRHVVKL